MHGLGSSLGSGSVAQTWLFQELYFVPYSEETQKLFHIQSVLQMVGQEILSLCEMELFLDFQRENISFREEIVVFGVSSSQIFVGQFLNSHNFVTQINEGSSDQFHPVFNENTLVSVRVKHVENNSFRLSGEISINCKFFVFRVGSLSEVSFDFLLQEDHVVITVEVIVFRSIGEHSFAGDFDFLLSGDIGVHYVMVESGWELVSVNERFEVGVFHEKSIFGSREE